jgi:hypothetical protein
LIDPGVPIGVIQRRRDEYDDTPALILDAGAGRAGLAAPLTLKRLEMTIAVNVPSPLVLIHS